LERLFPFIEIEREYSRLQAGDANTPSYPFLVFDIFSTEEAETVPTLPIEEERVHRVGSLLLSHLCSCPSIRDVYPFNWFTICCGSSDGGAVRKILGRRQCDRKGRKPHVPKHTF